MKKFVRSCTQARLKKLKEELRRAAHDPEDQKAIHDLRVAIRRFTQCLRTFAQFFDAARTKPMRRRLRRLMDRCGAVRNGDIALEVLRAAGLRSRKLNADLGNQRRYAQEKLARRLSSLRKKGWGGHLHAGKEGAGVWDLKESAAENSQRVLPALAEELFAAGDLAAAEASVQKLHRFRLQVKRFRYTFELFQPLYRMETERGMAMLRDLQDKLGAINDCVVTLEMVKKDRRAAAAVRKLLISREAEFRKYWASQCGPEIREWWKTTLGSRRSNGTLHITARRSGTAGSRDSG
jgi:CHAD domain-containing protein